MTDNEPQSRSEINAAWDEVGARFADLGRLIKERQERRSKEAGETDAPTAEPTGAEPSGTDEAGAGDAADTGPVRQVIDALDDAFSSLGDVVRDPAFKREAKGTLEAFGAALGVTFSELGEQLRDRFDKSRGDDQPTS